MNIFDKKLSVDCSHIYHYDNNLYNHIIDFPCESIQIFEKVANQVYLENLGDKYS